MLEIIKERNRKKEVYYTYEFDRGDGSGFTFPCNSIGEIQFNECNKESYDYCMQHQSEFIWKGVQKHECSYTEPAIGKCHCGEEIELWNQYQGACECPKCGQWYNLFGQELINPEYWEEE